MGYNSKVYILCNSVAYERLDELFQQYPYDKPDYIKRNPNNEDYLLEWDWTKWYEDDKECYPGIYAIMQLLWEMTKLEDDSKFGYLRLGEDDEDNDFFDNDYNYTLYIHRDLDVGAITDYSEFRSIIKN